MKMLVIFLAKCVRNAVKTVVVDRKSQKALALLYVASKPLRKATNSSDVPTEFEQNRRGKFELRFILENFSKFLILHILGLLFITHLHCVIVFQLVHVIHSYCIQCISRGVPHTISSFIYCTHVSF